MRQLMLDELSSQDTEKLHKWLRKNTRPSSMVGLYWVDLAPDLLDSGQFECTADQPFRFAVEVGDTWAKFEFLVRSATNMSSLHVKYAGPAQQKFIIDLAERIIRELDLKT
jgi:type IV secretory pathway protease TraF